jgi:hypothetical protein
MMVVVVMMMMMRYECIRGTVKAGSVGGAKGEEKILRSEEDWSTTPSPNTKTA